VFSMAMTAWAAKLLSSAICFSVNRITSWRKIAMAQSARFLEHWHHQKGPCAAVVRRLTIGRKPLM